MNTKLARILYRVLTPLFTICVLMAVSFAAYAEPWCAEPPCGDPPPVDPYMQVVNLPNPAFYSTLEESQLYPLCGYLGTEDVYLMDLRIHVWYNGGNSINVTWQNAVDPNPNPREEGWQPGVYIPSSLYATCGVKTVTATVTDNCPCFNAGTQQFFITIHVKPDPPECFADDEGSRLGCGADGGSGSGCGSCGGGGEFPWASTTNPVVYQPLPVPGGPGGGSGNTGGGGCSTSRIEVFDTCGGFYARIKDRCGKCYIFYLGRKPRTNPLSFSFPLDDGSSVNGWLNTDGSTTFHFDYGDGTDMDFSIGAPPIGTFVAASGPTNVTGPDGDQTTFSYGDTYDTVTTSNGDTWKYYHANGDTKITKIEQVADGASYTEIGYVPSGSAAGKLQSVVVKDSLGAVQSQTDYTYYTDGRLNTVTKGSRTRTFDYSEDGRKITAKDISGAQVLTETEYDYGTAGSATTTVTRKHGSDPAKNEVTVYGFYLDGTNKAYVGQVTDPNGKVTTYNINTTTGQTNSIADPSGMTTSYSYNSKGAVTQITYTTSDSQTASETNTYYTDGGSPTVWLRTHRDIRGTWTYYQRNSSTLWQVDAIKTAPSGTEPDWNTVSPIKQYEYYGASDPDGMPGQVKREITPNIDGATSQVTEYKYSESGKKRNSPTQTIYQYWNGSAYETKTSTTHYDDEGNVLSTTDANGRTVWYRYDALDRQTLTVYKWVNDVVDGTPEVYTQNHYTCCTLDWTQDENGNKTHYAYDDLNRVTKTWTDVSGQDEDHPLVEYAYDTFGNQQTVTTRSDVSVTRVTNYTYDKLNRVTKIDYPGGIVGSEEFGYNDAGNLLWKKDGNGAVTLYKYDTWNRLTNVYYNYTGSLVQPISYAGLTADVSYGYDGNTSLKTSMVDSSGTSSYTYDWRGRLDHYTPPVGLSSGYYVDYDYNDAGMKTAIKITNGTVTPYNVSYDYFANGWLKVVKSGANTIASYGYDGVGNRTLQANGNGTSTEYAYDTDSRYRTSSITHKHGAQVLATIGYPSRDNLGNPLSMTDWTGTWNYDYDANNRLDSATAPNPVPDQPAGGDYGYDWVGNRLNPPTGANHMVYNAADQLTLWPGMYSYTYWPDGSLKEVKNAAGTQVLKSYTYTLNGLLSQASFNGKTLTNMWDASNNRVSFIANSVSHTFVYDPTAGVPAVLKELNGATSVYYIREPGGGLIARVDESVVHFYHFDQLGSTRLLTISDGTTSDEYTYDSYGALISHNRSTGYIDQPYQYVGQFGYYTHYQEPEFGLLQLGVRFYDSHVGRFTQKDPAFDGLNYYAYVYDNPLLLTDPNGEFAVVIVIGAGLSAGEAAALIGGAAAVLCGANEDCRQALAQLAQSIASAIQAAGNFCRSIRCKIELHPPHHKFLRPRFGIPPWKWCWMKHLQIMCWRDGVKNSTFINQHFGFGPCYRYRNGRGGITH